MINERAKILAKPFHIYSDGIGFHRLGWIIRIYKLKHSRGFGIYYDNSHPGITISFWRSWRIDPCRIDWKKARATTFPHHDNDGQTA
jgi:hypothetical protein